MELIEFRTIVREYAVDDLARITSAITQFRQRVIVPESVDVNGFTTETGRFDITDEWTEWQDMP